MERTHGGLTSSEVCAIIKAAGENRVQSLEFAGLKLQFHPTMVGLPVIGPEVPVSREDQAQETSSTPLVELTKEQKDEIQELQRESAIEQLKLIDPLLYEQLLSEGKLEDVHDEQDTGRPEPSL